MTVTTTISEISYAGNSVTTGFTVPFYFLADTDLVVTETTGSTVVDMVLNVDYTVNGAGQLVGGSVTMVVATPAGTTLKISRVEPITQETDYIQDDAFPAESHERALDKLTMICQQLQTDIDNLVLDGITDATTASNLGGGLSVYKQKVALDLQFRSLSSPSNGTVGIGIVSDRIEIDVKLLLTTANTWSGGQQYLEYTVTDGDELGDRGGWAAVVNENSAAIDQCTDNFVALIGHALHLGPWDGGAYWGIATEAWSNADGAAVLVGGELSVIQQSPDGLVSVGMNAVFKNRPDVATHPTAPIIDGTLYNLESIAVYITSQARPTGGGVAWNAVGSGWQTAIKIGDPGFGAGLDWEGGSQWLPEESDYKAYTTILDMTDALEDLAGGTPWFALYRNSLTYWGMRFNGTLTGQLSNHNIVINSGGSLYTVGDQGTIGTGGAIYQVTGETAGVVTQVCLKLPASNNGGVGYVPASGVATAATSGSGTGLTLDLVLSNGYLYGGWLDVSAAGTGYVVGQLHAIAGGAASTKLAIIEITSVVAGAVTGFRLRTGGFFSLGTDYTTGVKATVALAAAGTGLTIAVVRVSDELLIGGEKWEFWRMLNPADPFGTGARQGYIDASFPGTTQTIDTSGSTYTFPIDRPL